MIEKLEEIEKRYEELTQKLSDPKVIAQGTEFQKVAKERARLEETVEKYREYKRLIKEIEEAAAIAKEETDPELKEWAEGELEKLQEEKANLETILRNLLEAEESEEHKSIIMEIRAGTGGEEAALFAADLFKMYAKFAERKGWKIELLNSNRTALGGFKEIIFAVEGKEAYKWLKYESGVHRVQRVPVTESSGRIHTSAASVAVLPEPEEIEVQIEPKDLKIETFLSSGPGGQHMQKTESAVRITHLPTGLTATCQDERSQHQNKEKALRLLRARLLERAELEQQKEREESRRAQIGTGDRSEKIRTYNFNQNRVTDHRIGLTLYQLQDILEGDLDNLIEALVKRQKVPEKL